MNFIEAINLIYTNTVDSVKRFDWELKHVMAREGTIIVVNGEDSVASIEDILANDWIIMGDKV